MVNVTADNELEFRGHGHGARGVADYALRLSLSAGVKAELSKWFVCGPSVRVRLEVCILRSPVRPEKPKLSLTRREGST
eukprot:2711515-Pleurochrysis_carterae.AAC.1